MAVIIRELVKWYKYINEDLPDPRNNDRFMLSSPWPTVTLLGFYIYFVLDRGPRFMARRQPFKLDRILQLYDLLQILLNAYLFYKALVLAWLRDYSYFCEPIDYSHTPRATEIAKMVWVYFMIKNLDLLETVFFILRKKENQVSFLHVYHHIAMVMATWIAAKFIPGGHVTFLGLLNTFVHIIMYTHYLLTSMKVNTNAWKKYITQLQLIQFFMIILHQIQLFWANDCGFSIWPAYLLIPQNIFMMILFWEFYYKTYIKKKQEIKTVLTKTETSSIYTEVLNERAKIL
nr:PREDICTED: elongation of very long chain fatty acids protein 7-like [Linepithema humile]